MRLTVMRLFLLPVDFRRDFQAQAVQPDEAGGVVLVVSLGRVGLHRGDVRIVKAHRALRPATMMLPL